jgi:hypothetical protein
MRYSRKESGAAAPHRRTAGRVLVYIPSTSSVAFPPVSTRLLMVRFPKLGLAAASFAALALLLVARPAAAQQPTTPTGLSSGPVLVGKVLDSSTGKGLPYAVVALDKGEPHVITDSTGTFHFPGLRVGIYNMTATQMGYARLTLPVVVAEKAEAVEFKLFPDPVAIEGIKVMADRFRGRLNAITAPSQSYEHDKLEHSTSFNVPDFLANEAMLSPAACPGPGQGNALYCFNRRGQVVQPQVFLDEAPLMGGLSQLDSYHPDDLYRIEVIGNGLMVRAYTRAFVDRLTKNPHALEPIIIK